LTWNLALLGNRRWFRALAANLIGLSWALPASSAGAEVQAGESLTVSIAAPAYWCPYACEAGKARWGFTVEIARTALEASGHSIVYRNLPYDRALVETARGDVDAIIPAFKGETPGFIFPENAVSVSQYCFYVSEEEPWRYAGPDSLESIRFVATSGYSYSNTIDAYIEANLEQGVTLIMGDDIPRRLGELVRMGRFNALLDDRLLLESAQSRAGLVNAGCLEERHAGYLALSPEHPDRSNTIAQAFDRGIRKIRADGRLCTILEKYGLDADFVPELNQADCLSDNE
jgi:polar amino acid transport system substrate-binding protein